MLRIAGASTLALGASSGQAQTQDPPVEEVVVTAGRTGDPLAAFGGTVIERAAIDTLQPVTAIELLDRAVGVRAFDKNGLGGASYLGIRGGEPNFTLVLLDGVRVNDPSNSRGGAFDFAQIDPFALERIEIASGALSAVHGADSLSGVVNLRLRTPDEDERLVAARLTTDTRGAYGGSATLGAGWQGGHLLGGGSVFDSDGDAGDISNSGDLERRQLFGRMRQELGKFSFSALALGAATDRAVFPEDSGGPRLAVIREREKHQTDLLLAALDIARADRAAPWQPRLSFDWLRQDEAADTPAIAPGAVIDGVPAIAADSRFRRVEAIFENRLATDEALEIAFGGTYLRETGRAIGSIDAGFPTPTDFSIERDVAGGFAEVTVRPDAMILATLGIRFDDPSAESRRWTRRVALRLELSPRAPALIASWSEGFKLPSLYALAYPIIANPDLRPEQSESFEVGIERSWAEDQGRARATWFRSRYMDLIDFDPRLFTNVNRSRVTVEGVEAEIAAPISPALNWSANITWLQTNGPADAPPLRSRPKWQGGVSMNWAPHERLELFLSATHISDFFDSSVPTGLMTLEERTELAAAMTWRLGNTLAFTLTANNLLSEDYEDAAGFPAPGLVVRASLAMSL